MIDKSSLVIKWRAGTAETVLWESLAPYGAISKTVPQLRYAILRLFDPFQAYEISEAIKALPHIEHVEYQALRDVQAFYPNDPYGAEFSTAYLTAIHAYEAWGITTGSSDIIVTAFDTGIDTNHPDLIGRYVGGKAFQSGVTLSANRGYPVRVSWRDYVTPNMVSNSIPASSVITVKEPHSETLVTVYSDEACTQPIANPYTSPAYTTDDFVFYTNEVVKVVLTKTNGVHIDLDIVGVTDDTMTDIFGHGTATAGTMAAKMNNNTGIAGIAQCSILQYLVVRAYSTNSASTANYYTADDLASALVDATDSGCRVINISLGGGRFSQMEHDACAYATERGVVIIAASGNSSYNGNVSITKAYKLTLNGIISLTEASSMNINITGAEGQFNSPLGEIQRYKYVNGKTVIYLMGTYTYSVVQGYWNSCVSGVSLLSRRFDTSSGTFEDVITFGTDFTVDSFDPVDMLFFPASYDNVISVSGTGQETFNYFRKADYAQINDYVDLMAPASYIPCCFPTYSPPELIGTTPPSYYNPSTFPYVRMSGTSFAAPIIAGTVALMLSRNPSLGYSEILSTLQSTANSAITDTNGNTLTSGIGAGMVNTYAAVSATEPLLPICISAAPTIKSTSSGAAVIGYGTYENSPLHLLGHPSVTAYQAITASGIVSSEVFGTPSINPQPVTSIATSIVASDAMGVPTIAPQSVTIIPAGIVSFGESLGDAKIIQQIVTNGFSSITEAFGTPVITTGVWYISPDGITSDDAVGQPNVIEMRQIVAPIGIAVIESLGLPGVSIEIIPIIVTGIPEIDELFGLPRVYNGEIPPLIVDKSGNYGLIIDPEALGFVLEEREKGFRLEPENLGFYLANSRC